jgi:hypothetical protein
VRTHAIALSTTILCLIVLYAAPAPATTITVDAGGSGDEYNIQGGINAANPGDTVLVLPGTYTGASNRDLNFGGTNLVLLSSGGKTVTTIDCQSAGRGFVFDCCEDTTAVVKGFTITNAVADSGAGAFCTIGSDPRFEDCAFSQNDATLCGGGLCSVESSPIIRDCTFDNNSATDGVSGPGYGGGIACFGTSNPLIQYTSFESNVAHTAGGGLFCDLCAVRCTQCEFVENNIISYGNEGAGVALMWATGTLLENSTFRENGKTQTSVGGGLFASATDFTMTNCDFIDNTAGTAGGARLVSGTGGTISGCAFYGNVAEWGTAAGISCSMGSHPIINNCTFVWNWGHHIECNQSSPTVGYCILAFTQEEGLPVSCAQGTETPNVHHCFVFGNADADTICGGNENYIENSDPKFCDVPGGNVRLCENSPCIAGATWASQVGAEGEGCAPCGSAVEPESWGAIKAIYR